MKTWILSVMVLIFMSLFFPGCLPAPKKTTINLAEVSRHSKVIFPVGARLENSKLVQEVMGSALWAKVTLTEKDSAGFLETAQKDLNMKFQSDASRMSRASANNAPAWWQPSALADAYYGEATVNIDGWTDIIIGQEAGGKTIAYLYWNSG